MSRPIRIVLPAVLCLLAFAPAARAGVSDSANYNYRAVGFDYKGSGELAAGHFNSACTPVDDSGWEGSVVTTAVDDEVAPLSFGSGSLQVHSGGTDGGFQAKAPVNSKFSATYTETTSCERDGTVGSIGTTPCGLTGATRPDGLLSEAAAAFPFADLLERAETRRVDDVEAPICSLADLVAMKRSVGRERDLADLADLELAHGKLPDSSRPTS